MKSEYRIGTRGSKLALYQAELVKTMLEQNFPMLKFPLAIIKTSGDMIRQSGVDPFSTKRVYTREIEDALEKQEVDFAVHSAKDLAAKLPEGLQIGAVLPREDARDCFISRDKKKFRELAEGARIGTSAIRRRLLVLKLRPDLSVQPIRGNVDTRIRKLDEGDVDALVLAYAGVRRLGMTNFVTEIFAEEEFYPAPCQGAIVVESRMNDQDTKDLLRPLNHAPSAFQVAVERGFLRRLEGGCQLPCGMSTRFESEGQMLAASGILFSLDGSRQIESKLVASTQKDPGSLGLELADQILKLGGDKIIKEMREK